MLKQIGLSVALLAGLAVLAAPRQAKAETHFGVYIGTAPRVYTAPAPVYSYDPYAGYYDYPAPVYSYPAPVYVAPSYGYGGSYGYYGRGYRDRGHEWHERMEHERHEYREHNRGWRR